MPPEVAKYLHDALVACEPLRDFTAGKSFSDYERDALLRAGVEREFITIGEVLTQAARLSPEAVRSISSLREIVGFRNVLVHGYGAVHHPTVWGVLENELGALQQQITELLSQAEQ